MKKRLSSVCNNDENAAKILNELNSFNREEKCCKDNSDDVKNDYLRKILSDIIVNDLTEHQAKLAGMYYFGNINVVEIARLLGINRSSVSRGLRLANKKIAKNTGRYKVECIHIIDITDTPKVIGDISNVYKMREENAQKNTYGEMLEQYEKTIELIKKRIAMLEEELKTTKGNIERGNIYHRIDMLENELNDLHIAVGKFRKYID